MDYTRETVESAIEREFEELVKEASTLAPGVRLRLPVRHENKFSVTPSPEKYPDRVAEQLEYCRPVENIRNRIRAEARLQGIPVRTTVESDKSQPRHPLIKNPDGTVDILITLTKASYTQ